MPVVILKPDRPDSSTTMSVDPLVVVFRPAGHGEHRALLDVVAQALDGAGDVYSTVWVHDKLRTQGVQPPAAMEFVSGNGNLFHDLIQTNQYFVMKLLFTVIVHQNLRDNLCRE